MCSMSLARCHGDIIPGLTLILPHCFASLQVSISEAVSNASERKTYWSRLLCDNVAIGELKVCITFKRQVDLDRATVTSLQRRRSRLLRRNSGSRTSLTRQHSSVTGTQNKQSHVVVEELKLPSQVRSCTNLNGYAMRCRL